MDGSRRPHNSAPVGPQAENPCPVRRASRRSAPDWSHLEDLALEQLDVVVLGQDTCRDHLKKLLCGEQPSNSVHAHHAPPCGEPKRTPSLLSAPTIGYIDGTAVMAAPQRVRCTRISTLPSAVRCPPT